MSYFNEEEVKDLLIIADANDGHCDRCKRVLKIYKYTANAAMAKLLRAMATSQYSTGSMEINLTTLGLPYAVASQQTKTRLHGLIVQVKNDDGTRKASTWRITRKGFEWLRGEEIPERVIVFDNQVIGHEGSGITIHQISPEVKHQEEEISQPEAEVYHNVRQPMKNLSFKAKYRGQGYFNAKILKAGQLYPIEVSKMQMGKPVEVHVEATILEYKDIAAFQKAWQIIKETKNAE